MTRTPTEPVVCTNEADFNAALAAAGITTGVESFESLAVGGKLTPFDVGPFTLINVPPARRCSRSRAR